MIGAIRGAKYISLIIAIVMATYVHCFVVPAHAETEKVAPLNEGDPAPFSGTLFNIPAAAKLITDLKYNQEVCKLEKQKELGLLEASLTLQLQTMEAELESLKLLHNEQLKIKERHITYLDGMVTDTIPEWYESPTLWYVTGLLSGVIMIIGVGYAIRPMD